MRGTALRLPRSSPVEPEPAAVAEPREWPPAGWGIGGADNRHSRRVALLKRLLPAIAVALLLLIAMWPRLAPLWERMRLAFPAIDLRAARELQMVNPRYAGIDRQGRPFVITAATGRQLPDQQDLMSLQEPRADIKTHSGADITLTARTGIYQSQTQLLDLMDDVTLVHQNGTRFVTESARVDGTANTAAGDAPVEGHGPSGDIKAQGFRILDKGDTIIFTGRSDALLKSATTNAAKRAPAPAALPSPVRVAAAQAEAEARPALTAAARAAHPHPAARQVKAPAHPVRHSAAAHGHATRTADKGR